MSERIDLSRLRGAEPSQGPPRLLLTNDDGVAAPGLGALARRLVGDGFDVVVAAPDRDVSGCGTGIGGVRLDRSIEVATVAVDGVATPAYALPGTPGLAVMAAALGAFGPRPDLVVSGVNAGSNLGQAVIHSGTVGAALTAATFSIPALAVSLAPPATATVVDHATVWSWAGAVELAALLVRWMTEHRHDLTLNLNVPDAPLERMGGPVWAELADFGAFVMAAGEPGRPEPRVELRVESPGPAAEGSDRALLQQGYATVSELGGPVVPAGVRSRPALPAMVR